MPSDSGGGETGLRRGERKELERDRGKLLEVIDMFLISNTVISWIYTYIITYQRIFFK